MSIIHCVVVDVKLLQEKVAEVRDKEDEVDNISTSSRLFEASLQVSNHVVMTSL